MGTDSHQDRTKIIIVGAGPAGLAAAIRLKQSGENDFLILERSSQVGGVWRDNRYPGCACDIKSHLYSFSFAPKADWSREYAPQPEIFEYLQECANKFSLGPHLRFQENVQNMRWTESEKEWQVTTSKGTYRCQLLFAALGTLSEPAIPRLVGLEKFQGQVFHSANWPSDFNPVGKKIAVVGTGASACQFIPRLQPHVTAMHVYQRSAAWVWPREDKEIGSLQKNILQVFPFLRQLKRLQIYLAKEIIAMGFMYPVLMRKAQAKSLAHMHKAISNPELRAKLKPNFKFGCKRILVSDDYYPALAQPNVDVITDGIQHLTENSIVDEKGVSREIDALIFGTGFQTKELPFANLIYGKNGTSLSQAWDQGFSSHRGTMVTGFPNLFLLLGPHTGLGHSSVLYMLESQLEHILAVLKLMRQKNYRTIEVTSEAETEYMTNLKSAMQKTVWQSGGCDSWYLDHQGTPNLWPKFTFTFRRLLSKLDDKSYEGKV